MFLGQSPDVTPLRIALQLQPELWNTQAERKTDGSPHQATSDIWLRYNDLAVLAAEGYEKFTAQHDSVWHPAIRFLPQARQLIFWLMTRCEATRLGGVLITKIPPGGRVLPHVDAGWHPEYYNMKTYIPLQANPLCVNRVEDEHVTMAEGEAWYFDNTKEHEVVNDGTDDRITLIVCMRVEK
jgi:hypothetical protein